MRRLISSLVNLLSSSRSIPPSMLNPQNTRHYRYESYLYEDLLREAQGVVPMVIRRGNSRRYVPWLQYLAIVGRRVVETVGGMLHAMFPRRIHAVTQEGFVIKVLSFVLAHNLKLLTQEMA
jgi:hypothetical protein